MSGCLISYGGLSMVCGLENRAMTQVIKSVKTSSLCGTCYRELPAVREFRGEDLPNSSVWITKTCPDHGYQEAMAEKSGLFWEVIAHTNKRKGDTFTHRIYNNMSMIEVTDRCNVNCKHCYHNPDNKTTDRDADWIIAKALTVHTPAVCLMGAEPTMRDDLPYIVEGVRKGGKQVTMYTNGVRMRDIEFVRRLKEAGLFSTSVSVHNPDYHSEKVWRWVVEGLSNIVTTGIQLGQVSFTVESPEQAGRAIDAIYWLWKHCITPMDFCIRSPAQIGTPFEQEREIFASELFAWLGDECKKRGVPFRMLREYGSNPYHVGAYVGVANVQVIHWADVHSIDLAYMDMGPWANFIDGTKGSFLVQAIQRDGMKKGWWQGRRLVPEGATRFTLYEGGKAAG